MAAQTVVDDSDDHCFAVIRFAAGICQHLRDCAVYLYVVLRDEDHELEKTVGGLETIRRIYR